MSTKILQIGNYPPPVCGWSMQTKLLVEELRRRGVTCDVLNINENRATPSSEYVSVHGGFDYLWKLIRFAGRGYRFQVHVNGQSEKGYVLALIAAVVGRLFGRPIVLSWRGGLQQKYFPRKRASLARWLFQLLFKMSGQLSCNNTVVKEAIEQYGIVPERVVAIPAFSSQHLKFDKVSLGSTTEAFLATHNPIFFCYVAFRPEYKLPMLQRTMTQFRRQYPEAGFIWLGFPRKEMSAAEAFVNTWAADEHSSLLMLGTVSHDEFLTLLTRSTAYIRTPGCDGVSASVLEALALGIPVVASENGHRPENVITYRDDDAADLCAKLAYLAEHYSAIKQRTSFHVADDNIARTADWLLSIEQPIPQTAHPGLVHVR